MCKANSHHVRTQRSPQRGDILIESLIGMLLMAIVGMGVVLVTSKVSISQRDMRMQEIAVNYMRAALLQNGVGAVDICATTPNFTLPNGEEPVVEVQGCTGADITTETAVINGVDVPGIPRPLFISATSTSLGQVVVGGSWVTTN